MIKSKICLNLHPNLKVNDDKQLSVNISRASGNTVQVTEDGLYAEASPGEDNVGILYDDTGTHFVLMNNGVVVGRTSPFSNERTPYRVTGAGTIHRTFTCKNPDGSDINVRKKMGEFILVGDMYRVLNGESYDYYLITEVTIPDTTMQYGGNAVKDSVKIATLPIDLKLCSND